MSQLRSTKTEEKVKRAKQAHAADRLIKVAIIAYLVCEGVFFSFIHRFIRRLMRKTFGYLYTL